MKKALITGITGQDGSYLSSFLLDGGYDVYGLVTDHDRSFLNNLKFLGILERVTLVQANLMDLEQLRKTISAIVPAELYHLAAQSSVARSFESPLETVNFNVMGTHHLLEAIRTLGLPCRFYHASSSEMYGRVKELPVVEDSVLHPVSPYAISKAAGHWLAINYREAYDMFCCCGVLFNHESVLRPDYYVTKKIVSAAVRMSRGSKEKLVLGNVEVKRDWGYAPEYVKSMWLMLQQDEPNEYVIATKEVHSLREFAQFTFKHLGMNWEEHTITDKDLFRPSDIEIIYGDPLKAKTILGWKYNLTFEDLIQRLVEDELSTAEGGPSNNSAASMVYR